MLSKLDDLIAATLAASQPQGCWAAGLEGDAKKYIEAMVAAERSGEYGKVSRVTVQRNLVGLGVKIGESQIRAHLTGTCSCPI